MPTISLFGDNSLAMRKMVGRSATASGAIKAEDVPQALSRLKAALALGRFLPSTANGNTDAPEASMTHSWLPLIELLSATAKKRPRHVG